MIDIKSFNFLFIQLNTNNTTDKGVLKIQIDNSSMCLSSTISTLAHESYQNM